MEAREINSIGELYDLMRRTVPVDRTERLPAHISTREEVPSIQDKTAYVHPQWYRYSPRGNAGVSGTDTQRVGVFQIGFRQEDPVYVLNYGCQHRFETISLGNCYTEHRCTNEGCDYAYRVDSSD